MFPEIHRKEIIFNSPRLWLPLVLLHLRMIVGHSGSGVRRALCRCTAPRGHGCCLRVSGHTVHVVGGGWLLVAGVLALWLLLLHSGMRGPVTRLLRWSTSSGAIVSKVRVVSVEHVGCIAVHLSWERR